MELGVSEGSRKKRDRSEGPNNCAEKRNGRKREGTESLFGKYSERVTQGEDRRFLHPAAIAKFHGNAPSRGIS